MEISTVLSIIACVCFILASFGVPVPRLNLGWLGLFFWALASLVEGYVETKG